MEPSVCPICATTAHEINPTTIYCPLCTAMFTETPPGVGTIHLMRQDRWYIITGFASTNVYTLPADCRAMMQLHAERLSGQIPF